jgi:outer membrane protein assembly factor BamE (lipoprotein component of BamABCDE complex)
MRRHSVRPGPRLALLAVLALAGCSAIERRHGYAPDDATLSLIDVGVDTRESVAEKAGEPGATGVLAGGDFYYVADTRRTLGPRPTVIADRQVVAITFDGAGRVANVERFGLERGRVVPLSRRVTASNVESLGILRQLFGTLGQIRAEDVVGE